MSKGESDPSDTPAHKKGERIWWESREIKNKDIHEIFLTDVNFENWDAPGLHNQNQKFVVNRVIHTHNK